LLDAAGFAAAAWHRGVPAWYVPTTLVAQVDAALGGKTGLDLGPVKNQIGLVRQPELIWADPSLLATLPEKEFRSGLGEVAKTALLAGGDFYGELLSDAPALRARDEAATARAVAACLRYKASIVAGDPDDRGLARYVLNAGHTLGHVYEAAAAAAGRPLPHGLCVAAGLAAEARLLPGADVASIDRALEALALRTPPPRVSRDEAVRLLKADKKRTGATVRVPLIRAPGRIEPADVPLADLAAAAAGS
jgi:3-dehydroquinate synthase